MQYLFNKKYTILYLILLFLFVRLYLLFAGLEGLISPYPGDGELYRGTIAKIYIDGAVNSINSLFYYQRGDHNGISTVESLATVPFFYVFGPSLVSLKLVALTFLLATMVLWFIFVKRYVSFESAVITALLFIFAPPSFTAYNLALGYHSVPLFFDILALVFFFEMIRNKIRLTWYALFGIVCGFAFWVDAVFAITLVTCIALWFIHDKIFFLKKTFAVFVISFFIGFSVWFYYTIHIRHFQVMSIFEYSLSGPKPIYYKKFLDFLTYKLPYSLCFKDYIFSGVFLNYFYYGIFAIAFGGLIWFQGKSILKILSSFLPLKWQNKKQVNGTLQRVPAVTQCGQIITVESFFLGYIIIFILAFTLSGFDVRYKSNSPWDYRFFTPLYPFIFGAIAVGLNKLLNIGKTPFKPISYGTILILISAGIVGLLSQTNVRDFGKGLTFKGYSYRSLPTSVALIFGSRDLYMDKLVKLGDRIDNGLYKKYLYFSYGIKVAYVDKIEPGDCESKITDVEKMCLRNFYEGVGYGYGSRYRNDESLMLQKLKSINLTNKHYEKYLFYGIATSVGIMGQSGDKLILMISQIDSQFQPYFYQGLGFRMASKPWAANVNKVLLHIDKANQKYYCIGVGHNFSTELEWAFPDKRYYIGFDSLNKDYWPDCYYGLGWGIGDFFEFDMDRYLAVINNNVSAEYQKYCFKGLADRLRWKFGNNVKIFQKVMEHFPEPYKTLSLGIPGNES